MYSPQGRRFTVSNPGRILLGLLLIAIAISCLPTAAWAQSKPEVASLAPLFTLKDVEGKTHSLQDWRGRPVVLFFFCGCVPCQECARAWAQLQQSGALKTEGLSPASGADAPQAPPVTLVVYTDEADAARAFGKETGLDLAQTTLLTDPKLQVTQIYGAEPCPRVFVLDPQGVLRYTNPEKEPQKTPAVSIVSRIVAALRQIQTISPAPSPGVASPSASLSVLAADGVQQKSPDTAAWNAGTVEPRRTPLLEHTFTLKNTTQQPIGIKRVIGSCGCETIVLTKSGAQTQQLTLAPGEQAEVKVTVRLAAIRGGRVVKHVWVYGSDVNVPIFTLDINFEIPEHVRFTPEYLDFGRVAAGTERALPLTVEVDTSVLANGELPPLISTAPGVQVLPQGSDQRAERDGKTWIVRSCRVLLPATARTGYVAGVVMFAIPGVTAGPAGATTSPSRYAAATLSLPLLGKTAQLNGMVVGRLSAAPGAVFFGSVQAGAHIVRRIVLTGVSPQDLQDLSVASSSPNVVVNLTDAPSPATQGATPTRLLEVTLNPDTPVGILQAQVMITSGKGERLALSVIAEVVGASGKK